jgi:hypothetical protein
MHWFIFCRFLYLKASDLEGIIEVTKAHRYVAEEGDSSDVPQRYFIKGYSD